jgi:hypothetical protein
MISGRVSPLAKAELEKRGFVIVAGLDDRVYRP